MINSRERNIELLLVASALGFAFLGWRSLDVAAFPLPANTARILAQFTVSALVGTVALRVLAPNAPAQPYAIAVMLSAIGLVFVIRLAPTAAVDQANWISVGIVAFAISLGIARRGALLRRYTYTFGAAALGLLFVTGIFGETINGARLWINVAGQSIQTTEIIKVFTVLFLAGYFAERGAVLAVPRLRIGTRSYSSLPYLVPLLAVLLALVAALALLKDLGSVALLVLLGVAMLYVSTGLLRYLAAGVLLLAVTGFAGYVAFSHAQVRIDAWLNPGDDPAGTGYQTLQATYAIQAGGITGAGLGLGEPDQIPAAATDYVFSAISEELGLAGAMGVVLLYVVLLYSGLGTAKRLSSTYDRTLASGITLLLSIQAAIIIAGNLRVIPTTGITLPFVSYGGSSLVVNFALLGLLLGLGSDGQSDSS